MLTVGPDRLAAASSRRPTVERQTVRGVAISNDPGLPAGGPTKIGAPVPGGPDAPAGVSGAAAIKGVLKTPSFRRLWYCTGLSSLGDWLGLLATTALATQLATGYQAQNYALGLVLVIRLLPSAILGPLAGAFADRFDRRYTMVITDILRFFLFIVIAVGQSLPTLYVATFLIECFGLFWNPAKDASVPNLVRKDQLEAANQLSLITTYGLTPVAAAALFSLLALISKALGDRFSFFSTNQVGLALYFNAATFLVGAITVYFIREISGQQRNTEAGESQPSLWRMLRDGAHFVRTTGLLRGLILGILGAFAAGGAVIGAGKTYVRSLGGGDAAYGMLFGTVFVGLGLGMALGPRVAREVSRRRLFGLSIVFAGTCLALTAVMPHVVLAMIVVLGVGFGAGVGYLAGITLLGAEIEDEMRGRVFAFIQSMVRVVMILALAAVPVLVGTIGQRRLPGIGGTVDGTRIVLFAAGLLAVLAGIVAYRQMDERSAVPVLADLLTSLRRDTSGRRRLHAGGVLIAFEGGEGAGKSSQIRLLAQSLRSDGNDVVITHEPGATSVGRQIRKLLLDSNEPISPRSEALLFAADRAQHVATVIRPALDRGDVVLTDRFVDSSLAYQGAGRTLSTEDVKRVSRWATEDLVPDLTILLDIPPEIGLARAQGRDGAAGPDRLERETLAFHVRVRQGFRKLAESDPNRYLVLDAMLDAEELAATIRIAVLGVLSSRPMPTVVTANGHARGTPPERIG
ncbi:MAG: dTMP kinase [Pseudonocardiales bacterium]|nr:dTMP kinase [Pseudonocardiales bacterium]